MSCGFTGTDILSGSEYYNHIIIRRGVCRTVPVSSGSALADIACPVCLYPGADGSTDSIISLYTSPSGINSVACSPPFVRYRRFIDPLQCQQQHQQHAYIRESLQYHWHKK